MRGIKFVFLVAVAIAGLTLSTGVGASTGKGSAPIKAGAAQMQKVIINGTVRKQGQIPARVTRLLKKSVNNPNCPGADTSASGPTVQSCVWPADYTGSITCTQSSSAAIITQICDASQIQLTGSNKTNNALIVQVIYSKNPGSLQDGKQIVNLRQTAFGTGWNNAGIAQYIKQSAGPGTPDDTDESDVEPDAPAATNASQKQESHQTIHLRQISESGSNNAPIFQFLRQRERASHAAMTNQDQNADPNSDLASLCRRDPGSDDLPTTVVVDENANQCILSNQTSASGKQNLWLTGDYNQFQRARKAAQGHQVQGIRFMGGSDYGLIQNSGGVSTVSTIQNERQVQRGVQVGTPANFLQSQNGPRKGSGSAQLGNSADKWTGRQTSTQIQTRTLLPSFMKVADVPPSGQTNFLLYSAQQTPAGTMDVRQTATQNNGTPVTNTCSASPCEIAIVCAGEGCTKTLNCPVGQVIDPTTGQCTSDYCAVFPSAPTCTDYFMSIAPSSLYQRNLYTQRR
jgi:hypothetical protein